MSKALGSFNANHVVFEDDNSIYYPTACCEIFHIKKAIYFASALQFLLSLLALLVYISLDLNGFIQATWLIRPTVSCSVLISVFGTIFAVTGGIWKKTILIQCQVTILFFLISLSDICAVCLLFTMAIGKRTKLTAEIPALLVSMEKFDHFLGPFWIYLLAVMLHMVAAVLMCLMGVNKRFIKYLENKKAFGKNENEPAINNNTELHDAPVIQSFRVLK